MQFGNRIPGIEQSHCWLCNNFLLKISQIRNCLDFVGPRENVSIVQQACRNSEEKLTLLVVVEAKKTLSVVKDKNRFWTRIQDHAFSRRETTTTTRNAFDWMPAGVECAGAPRSGKAGQFPDAFFVCHVCSQCYGGGIWKCTRRVDCPGRCTIAGSSYFQTFDGKMYGFEGECEYALVMPGKRAQLLCSCMASSLWFQIRPRAAAFSDILLV